MNWRAAIFFGLFLLNDTFGEPKCSKYHYEEQVLERTIRTEIKVESIKEQVDSILGRVEQTLIALDTKLQDIEKRSDSLKTTILESMQSAKDTVSHFKGQ